MFAGFRSRWMIAFSAFGNLNEQRDGLVDGKGTPHDALRQRLALDELHDQETVFEAVQGCDGGMVQ